MNKFELVRSALKKYPQKYELTLPRLLDVGCRGCELKPYVADMVDYVGVDLFQNPEGVVDYVLDVSGGLPMEDSSFEYVVALDLVEHLDDFEGGLNELLRVTKGSLILILPNLGHILFRMRFLLHGRLSDKYDMKYGMGKDRHRWVTTLNQCDALIHDFALDNNLKLTTIWFNESKKQNLFATMCRVIGVSPNLWAWASLYVLKKPEIEGMK